MDMTTESCRTFLDALASKAPTPGGGGASALVGAVAMALGGMVAHLTEGKKKYADVQEEIARCLEKAAALQSELLALVEEDAKAFLPLAEAYGLPKDTEEQRQKKATVLEQALRAACAVPIEIMARCCEVAEVVDTLSQIGSKLAVSDAGCAAACCRAALTGAALNVRINTKLMEDRAYAKTQNDKVQTMLKTYVPLCDNVYDFVAAQLIREG